MALRSGDDFINSLTSAVILRQLVLINIINNNKLFKKNLTAYDGANALNRMNA